MIRDMLNTAPRKGKMLGQNHLVVACAEAIAAKLL